MKKMKKVLSILLASVMTLAMAAPGFAAPGDGEDSGVPTTPVSGPSTTTETGNGSITIPNATIGHTYTLYRLFKANPATLENGKTETEVVAYTATLAQKNAIEGYSVEVEETVGETTKTVTYENPFDFTATPDNDVYNVSLKAAYAEKSDENNKYVITFLQNFFGNPRQYSENRNVFQVIAGWKATEADGISHTFTKLPYGYYFITSSLGTVVSIDSTNPNHTILDKNQGPHWDDEEPGDGGKKIVEVNHEATAVIDGESVNLKGANANKGTTEVSANNGDEIKFEVSYQATNYDKDEKITFYRIEDILGKGMDYVPQVNDSSKVNVSIKVGNEDITNVAGAYQLSDIQEVKDSSNAVTGHKFSILIPWLNDDKSFKYNDPVDSVKTVTITYSAKVNDEAVVASTGNKNSVGVGYWTEKSPTQPENPDTPSPKEITDKKETTTYTFALAINKTDKEGKPLSGATFKLTKGDTNINVKPVMEKDAEGQDVPVAGLYVFDNGTKGTNEVVSPANGVITIKGLAEGTYTLTETIAPAGYNLLTATKDVKALWADRTTTTTTTTVYYDGDGGISNVATDIEKEITTAAPVGPEALTNVVNIAGTLLPSTGGIGTTIFYAAGIILMAGAVFFVVRKRRA